jgi:hypothetical protein
MAIVVLSFLFFQPIADILPYYTVLSRLDRGAGRVGFAAQGDHVADLMNENNRISADCPWL